MPAKQLPLVFITLYNINQPKPISMDAVIITIGDELLYGKTIDTNSAFMGNELANIGIRVHEKVSVSDDPKHIVEALNNAKTKAKIILITGGLGPTKDDLTKHTLAKYFHTELVPNEEILGILESFFNKRGITMLPAHRDQALMPAACTPLRNSKGTAWGMWFEQDGIVFVSMPGVPHEMKALMQEQVLPKIKATLELPAIVHRHINTAGLGESFIAEKIEDIEDSLPPHIKLAYLPELAMVRLRLTAKGDDNDALRKEVDVYVERIKERIEKHIYGYDETTLEQAIAKLLEEQKAFVSTAESCTGGHIASRITMVPGSSRSYVGSAVTYTAHTKHALLGVSNETLAQYGAVSEQTAKEMVAGACRVFETRYAIAVTGVAGPGPDEAGNPAGMIWIAVGTADNIITKQQNFLSGREQNIRLAGTVALEMLRKYLVSPPTTVDGPQP